MNTSNGCRNAHFSHQHVATPKYVVIVRVWTNVKTFAPYTPQKISHITKGTRMHSSKMRTARGSSHRGGLPQCMLGYTHHHTPGVGLETPLPPGVGLETPQVWAWRSPLARSLNFPLDVGLDTLPLFYFIFYRRKCVARDSMQVFTWCDYNNDTRFHATYLLPQTNRSWSRTLSMGLYSLVFWVIVGKLESKPCCTQSP